jgi:hypothetical protein
VKRLCKGSLDSARSQNPQGQDDRQVISRLPCITTRLDVC